MKVRCPNCGLYHAIDDTFENRIRRPFKADAMAAPLPGAINQAPAGMPNRETHVAVPFDQAKITGFFAAPLGGVAAYTIIMVIDATPSIEVTSWGKIAFTVCGAIVTGFSVAGWTWLKRLSVYDGLLWTIEEITGFDLDGDEEIGEPVSKVQVEIMENNIPRQIEEFDTDFERLKILAQLIIVRGKSFSEETAAEAGYTRKEWVRIRNKFIKREYATWNNAKFPKQGVSLRRQGIAIFGGVLSPARPNKTQNSIPGTNVGQRTNDLSGKYEYIEG